jgi:hypothetical protein
MFHPRRHRQNPKCPTSGKIGWASKADAEMAITNAKSNRSRSAASTFEKRTYKCPSCHAWHTTHLERK